MSEDTWDPTSLDSVIFNDPNWYEAEPSPPLPDPMYDEYGEFCGRVLINQHEWQVHYFDALNTKTGSDTDDEFHDALEQFADDPDSVINLIVYRANRAPYVCDHETVEAAPKFVMTSEPDYGQLHPRLGWLPVDAIKKTFERTTQLAHMPMSTILDNFRMNTRYGRYGATYNMVGLCCFIEELSLLPKNPTEAKLQATSTRGESTEPT
jgi:hypothetical protein